MIETEQPAEALTTSNSSIRIRCWRLAADEAVLETLVRAFLMVMQNVLGDLLLLPVDPAGDGDYYEGPRGEGC